MNTQILYMPAFLIAVLIIALANAGNIIANFLSRFEMPAKISGKIDVYDSDFNLIYESVDIVDRKMEDLVLKSDLNIETNNTHIYQLSR